MNDTPSDSSSVSELNDYAEADGVQLTIYNRDAHSVSRKNIDPDALKVLRRLNRFGYKAFLVGGGVRDLLLDKEPKDFDIATSATPKQLKSLFRNCRIIGRRFKLAHVYFRNRKIIEVATFRDLEEDAQPGDEGSRINENIFGNELTDAFRRDLTINALFYDLSNFSVVDYVGGMSDLENRLIRVIGDPCTRFQEDPIRIIRAIRHKVRASCEYEASTEDSIKKNRSLLGAVSRVRLYEELKKDFCGAYCDEYLRDISSLGLLEDLMPGLSPSENEISNNESEVSLALRALYQDELSLAEPSCAFVLIVLQALAGENPLSAAFNSPASEKERDKALQAVFSKVQIPRKEQEKVLGVLGTLFQFFTDSLEERRLSTLRHSRNPRSTHLCMQALQESCDELEVGEEEIELLKKRALKPQSRGRKGRKRRHGRSRRPKNIL